jgi:hypothetical protein
MSAVWKVRIDDPERAVRFLEALGTDEVRIRSHLADRAIFPGYPDGEAYYTLDADAYSEGQIIQLVSGAARRFGEDTGDLLREAHELGIPILALNTTLIREDTDTDWPAFDWAERESTEA